MKIIVVGIGQTLRGDDAVGVQAVEAWRSDPSSNAHYPQVEVGVLELPGLTLLEYISGGDYALIVDAILSDAPPGTLHLVSERDLAIFNAGSGSAHGWGVAETIALGRTLGRQDMPVTIQFLAITASQFDLGARLSPEIESNLPRIVAAIEDHVQNALTAR